ncbi:hypothetical protein N496_18635 (plasmid) [Clostridium botulinum A2B3 87]|uniref:hypothetical protein n=1 Tax=Clostridium botulinum TaxID=1491 RepID=UPI0004A5AAEA|nr:hypothetical protein [Clostridium botulinum]KEI94990.1 hypothetical protein N496_18635 [Clostridium botulinum A2B3 87]
MVKKKLKGLILVVILLSIGNSISSRQLNIDIMGKMHLNKYINKIKPYVQVINQKMQYIKDPSLNPKYMPEEQKKLNSGYKKEIQNINGKEVTIWKGDFTGNPYGNGAPWMGGKRLDFFDKSLGREGIQANNYNDSNRVWTDKLVKNAILMRTSDNAYTLIDYKKPFCTKITVAGKTKSALYAKVVFADDNGVKLDNGKYYNCLNSYVVDMSDVKMEDGKESNANFSPANFPTDILVMITSSNDNSSSYDIFKYCIVK